jgi:hypothetical protein
VFLTSGERVYISDNSTAAAKKKKVDEPLPHISSTRIKQRMKNGIHYDSIECWTSRSPDETRSARMTYMYHP